MVVADCAAARPHRALRAHQLPHDRAALHALPQATSGHQRLTVGSASAVGWRRVTVVHGGVLRGPYCSLPHECFHHSKRM